jgi:hypothetical protein
MAALRLDDPAHGCWLDQYALDYPAYYEILAATRMGAGAAASFLGEDLISWRQIEHERYAVIGHREPGQGYYAIPRDAVVPR